MNLTVGDVRFNVVRLGPGAGDPGRRPVVFIHGLIMDNLSSFYYTLAPAIARTNDVVLYDLRGHGRSERPPGGYRVEDGADDLFGILDALAIDGPVHLVGNSYGGTLALAAALRRPERVAGLALIEALPPLEGWAAEMIKDLSDLVAGFDLPGGRDYIARSQRSVRSMAAACEELVCASSMGDDFRASATTTPEQLMTLSCPTLLMYGENSDLLDRGYVLEETMPRSVLRVVEGCSHSLLMENPEEVGRELGAWLDRQSRTADAA